MKIFATYLKLRRAKNLTLYKDTLVPKAKESIEASYRAYEAGRILLSLKSSMQKSNCLSLELALKRAQADRIIAFTGIKMLKGSLSEEHNNSRSKPVKRNLLSNITFLFLISALFIYLNSRSERGQYCSGKRSNPARSRISWNSEKGDKTRDYLDLLNAPANKARYKPGKVSDMPHEPNSS